MPPELQAGAQGAGGAPLSPSSHGEQKNESPSTIAARYTSGTFVPASASPSAPSATATPTSSLGTPGSALHASATPSSNVSTAQRSTRVDASHSTVRFSQPLEVGGRLSPAATTSTAATPIIAKKEGVLTLRFHAAPPPSSSAESTQVRLASPANLIFASASLSTPASAAAAASASSSPAISTTPAASTPAQAAPVPSDSSSQLDQYLAANITAKYTPSEWRH